MKVSREEWGGDLIDELINHSSNLGCPANLNSLFWPRCGRLK